MFLFYFLVGVGFLALAWMVLRWFTEANPEQLIRAGQWVLAFVGGAVALWLVATGKAADAALLVTTLAPFFVRWKSLLRLGGSSERASEDAGRATYSGPMSREEAWRILGLEPGADDAAIRDAHRRLIKKLHPDQGGSGYLAAKINQAKDLLLGGSRQV